MDNTATPTYNIVLKEASFTAMNKKSIMFFYDKTDASVRAELLTIFPTALIHSITDYTAILTKKEVRNFTEEFKIKTNNAKQHLTKKTTE